MSHGKHETDWQPAALPYHHHPVRTDDRRGKCRLDFLHSRSQFRIGVETLRPTLVPEELAKVDVVHGFFAGFPAKVESSPQDSQ
jgi:hypothetical protein